MNIKIILLLFVIVTIAFVISYLYLREENKSKKSNKSDKSGK